ncbi:hypothetical protein AB0M57_04450 [Streptomyces sp. NPDC051597]|uniref:hypothetical protein n=1 Tax=Streptomyces sp. NPDC051597 TaxID=3155049 RepID=UPI00341369FD
MTDPSTPADEEQTRSAADRAGLRDRIVEVLLGTPRPGVTYRSGREGWSDRHGHSSQPGHAYKITCALCMNDVDTLADAVLAELPAPDQQTAVLADQLIERCPDHGCVEPAWEDGCHCEVVPLLRRLAGEAQQDPASCGPAPQQCDAEAGEPCSDHERAAAHVEGEHCFCGPECGDSEGAPR